MKTLLISPSSPIPATGGDRQRTDLIFRALKSITQVDLFLYRDEANLPPGIMERLEHDYQLVGHMPPPGRGTLGFGRVIRPLAPAVVDRLAHNFGSTKLSLSPISTVQQRINEVLEAGNYDLVVSRYLRPALAAAPWQQLPTIIDIDDYPPQVYAQRLEKEQLNSVERFVVKRHLHHLRQQLPAVLKNAAHLWIPNPADQGGIEHASVSVLPNIPYRPEKDTHTDFPPGANAQQLLMIGSLDYQVNIDGLNYFLSRVWPLVRAAQPGAKLKIAGNGLSDTLRDKWSMSPGVDVVGFVESVTSAYAECSFCIVPIFTGGGTKIKVLEALNHGRTCVASRHAVRGFDHVLHDDESLLIADDAEEMANACLRLMDNTDYRDKMAARGQQLVAEHFSLRRFADEIKSSVERVVRSN